MTFTIAAAYQWPKKTKLEKVNNSERAIKRIIEIINTRFKDKLHKKSGVPFNINYKRLRASAGRTMVDSIIKRIETAQVIIVDITSPNQNVFIELGIALYISRNNLSISVYMIKEIETDTDIVKDLPSDLQGYFISGYNVKDGKVIFKDNNSLIMSIASDINDYYSQNANYNINTDEINFKE